MFSLQKKKLLIFINFKICEINYIEEIIISLELSKKKKKMDYIYC